MQERETWIEMGAEWFNWFQRFPYGRAPFWIFAVAVASMAALLLTHRKKSLEKPDLLLATFGATHIDAYKQVIPEFERLHGVKVELQLVNWQALRGRLQNAMLAGTEVPDLVELVEGSMGFFTNGPLEDVGFEDLTERIRAEGLDTAMVDSRFSMWTARGRVFALPHDVHPVMLAYRKDIVDSLGIDVSAIETWNDFAEVGKAITRDLDGDGVPDRYTLDITGGAWGLRTLLHQRGGALFDSAGRVAFDDEISAQTIRWLVRHAEGRDRIFWSCGWGQTLAKAMMDGLAVFYIVPDWRTRIFEMDAPSLKGRMALMPLPAWEMGGRRTSTWGGTGLAITRDGGKRELAWEFAKFLYLRRRDLGARFESTNIIPPFKDAWNLPEFRQPNAYWSGQPLGALFARMAPETPRTWSSAYQTLAETKLDEVYGNAARHFKDKGEAGLEDFIRTDLHRAADYLRSVMGRNVFLARTLAKE